MRNFLFLRFFYFLGIIILFISGVLLNLKLILLFSMELLVGLGQNGNKFYFYIKLLLLLFFSIIMAFYFGKSTSLHILKIIKNILFLFFFILLLFILKRREKNSWFLALIICIISRCVYRNFIFINGKIVKFNRKIVFYFILRKKSIGKNFIAIF